MQAYLKFYFVPEGANFKSLGEIRRISRSWRIRVTIEGEGDSTFV